MKTPNKKENKKKKSTKVEPLKNIAYKEPTEKELALVEKEVANAEATLKSQFATFLEGLKTKIDATMVLKENMFANDRYQCSVSEHIDILNTITNELEQYKPKTE